MNQLNSNHGGAMTLEQMQLIIAKLTAENQALKGAPKGPRALSLKVSEKGAVSIYGMGRFPVTLYMQQWIRLFDEQASIKAFIEANVKILKAKEDGAKASA